MPLKAAFKAILKDDNNFKAYSEKKQPMMFNMEFPAATGAVIMTPFFSDAPDWTNERQ
jgi:hypothetical protein